MAIRGLPAKEVGGSESVRGFESLPLRQYLFWKLYMDILSPELEEFLAGSFKIRKTLEQVLPKEAIDYILQLIAKDMAHRKYLKLVEETEHEHFEDHESKEQN